MSNPLSFSEFFPFSRPCINEATIADVGQCIRSGWLTTGPRTQEFGEKLATYHNAAHAIPVSSGSLALILALQALNIKPGDEVITTPMTFISTISSILHVGAKPVFVDIDPKTLNITPKCVEKAVSPKTKVILPVHFAGYPLDLDGFYSLADRHDLTIIEDAAHASGTIYKGRKIGSFGHLQMLSFHPNKNMTSGEGGALLTQDGALATKIRQLSFHGIDRTAWNRFGKNGQQDYDVTALGYKGNMMDIQAIIGLHQLQALEFFVEKRKQLAHLYLEKLEGFPHLVLPNEPSDQGSRHSWHLFTIQIKNDAPLSREAFMSKMKERNVGTGLHYQSCHRFKIIQEHVNQTDEDLPVSAGVGRQIVSLPLHPQMTEDDVTKIVHIMEDILRK